jgi:phosphatidylglycerophosphate synthase
VRQVIPSGPLVGLFGVPVLLTALELTAGGGLGLAGWVTGIACAATLVLLLTAGLVRASRRHLSPADRVTLTRAVLACGVAALVVRTAVDTTGHPAPTAVLVALASVALVLDAVDGRIARRTRTVHPLGARFDMETDAFLILVLSVHVAPVLGWWVLGIGVARYVLLLGTVAGRTTPWRQAPLPPRRWRKVVAAYQGIALTVATADVLPAPVATLAVAAGFTLLLASFGTEVVARQRQFLRMMPADERATTWPALQRKEVDGSEIVSAGGLS